MGALAPLSPAGYQIGSIAMRQGIPGFPCSVSLFRCSGRLGDPRCAFRGNRHESYAPLPVLLAAIAFGGAGVVLGRAGRRDRRVLSLGGCFFCIASATSLRFVPLAAPLLPSKALLSFFTAFLPECFLPFFLWRFVREFPRVVKLDRWLGLSMPRSW